MITNRYEYIDALRGIAILFIVFGHIPMFCYGLPEAAQLSSFRAFTSMVQLPLFFFISGFLFSTKTIFNKLGGLNTYPEGSGNCFYRQLYLAVCIYW